MRYSHQSQQKRLEINDIQDLYPQVLSRQLIRTFHLYCEFTASKLNIFFSHTYVGRKLKCSRTYALKLVRILVDEGFIIDYPRSGRTSEYEIDPYYLEEKQQEKLKIFFNNFFAFSLFLLSSITSTDRIVTRLILNDLDLSKCTSTTVQKSTSTNEEAMLYLHDPTWYYQRCWCTGCTSGVPNEKRSLVEFEALLESTNMAQTLLPFTEEQLVILAQYPKLSLDYANKLVTKDLLSGKVIHNQFNYFHTICKAHAAKNPQTGKENSKKPGPRPSTFTEYVSGGKWVPGARIMNNDQNHQTTITHVETDEEFALNYEKAIHKRTLEDPEFAKKCARFDKNPIWHKFTPEQQATMWKQAHTDSCTCRRNEQAGLIMPDIAKKLSEKNIQTDMTPLEQQYYDPSIFEEVY